jgi:predicted HAD superfamily Cof-like phosphohydrolase
MSKTQFEMVGDFHRKFGLPVAMEGDSQPHIIDDKTAEFRFKFLIEELQELVLAHSTKDLVGVADALADLVYVALGTSHFYGLPFNALFDAVHESNMKKARAASADQSKRGSTFDVVKPEGWVKPDLGIILEAAIERNHE